MLAGDGPIDSRARNGRLSCHQLDGECATTTKPAGGSALPTRATWGLALVGLCLATSACTERTRPRAMEWWQPSEPDELPKMLNAELPFRYPVALYRRRVQGNVVLRLYVNHTGKVTRDSTRVAESSGQPSLDSAALAGADRLRFRPAYRGGVAVSVSLLFPVHFRHPEGQRLPGDSL